MHPTRRSLVVRFLGLTLGLSFLFVSSMPASVVAHVDQAPPPAAVWGPDPLFLRGYADIYAYERVIAIEHQVDTSAIVGPVLQSQDLPETRRYLIAPRRL